MSNEINLPHALSTAKAQRGYVVTIPGVDGEWVVADARMAGGGHAYDGDYPNGWQLTVEELRPDGSTGRRGTLYQSGAFSSGNSQLSNGTWYFGYHPTLAVVRIMRPVWVEAP